MPKRCHAKHDVLAFDKRFKVSLELTHSLTPFFHLLPYISRELRVKKNGAGHFVTVEIKVEPTKAPCRNRRGKNISC